MFILTAGPSGWLHGVSSSPWLVSKRKEHTWWLRAPTPPLWPSLNSTGGMIKKVYFQFCFYKSLPPAFHTRAPKQPTSPAPWWEDGHLEKLTPAPASWVSFSLYITKLVVNEDGCTVCVWSTDCAFHSQGHTEVDDERWVMPSGFLPDAHKMPFP